MNTSKLLITFAILATWGGWAQAQGEIYKCPDAMGRPTYTNVKRDTTGKSCTMVSREVSVVPAIPVARPMAAKATGPVLSRDESRRKILENELESEQKLLSDARQKLSQQEGVRNGDERSYVRVEDRLKPYQDTVDLHQKNIEQLQRELTISR
jgi:septal ring factor EnvC (AmiA/AmiB activator)